MDMTQRHHLLGGHQDTQEDLLVVGGRAVRCQEKTNRLLDPNNALGSREHLPRNKLKMISQENQILRWEQI